VLTELSGHLRQLIDTALAAQSSRVRAIDREMRLGCVVAPLAMVFHELVTHAVKYAVPVIADGVEMPPAGCRQRARKES
jgi:two-component sensor histidine kinase